MRAVLIPPPETQLPTPEEARMARDGSLRLAAAIDIKASPNVSIGGGAEAIELPASAARLLVELLAQMGQGNAVQVVPVHAELTTQQAADFLNVSRPYLIERLEAGELPFRKVGKHRRVRFEDVLRYKKRTDYESKLAMTELTALSQELGLY
ncbi:MAG: helix-turn-helix domain-containing protein [Rhodanobacteraceae bacterium]|nr:helix-turn-helix domain-containing protein [Rhodanobacteraceae bacterium]